MSKVQNQNSRQLSFHNFNFNGIKQTILFKSSPQLYIVNKKSHQCRASKTHHREYPHQRVECHIRDFPWFEIWYRTLGRVGELLDFGEVFHRVSRSAVVLDKWLVVACWEVCCFSFFFISGMLRLFFINFIFVRCGSYSE